MILPLLAACSGAPVSPPTDPIPPVQPVVPEAPPPHKPARRLGANQLELPIEGGSVAVTPVEHGTVRFSFPTAEVLVDPTGQPSEQAALILITDLHGDHLQPEAIALASGPDTIVIAPQAVADTLQHADLQVLRNGEKTSVLGLEITAVPMYNLVRGPEEGQLFHTKGRGNGYVIEAGGRRIYVAGDTECTTEMKALKDIDLAFVPMNLPYTMPPEEAAACVEAFAPIVAVPYHYRGSDRPGFEGLLEGKVTVELLEFYP